MPIYEYRCASCGAVSEFLEGVGRDAPSRRCASCGSAALARIPSAGRVLKGGAAAAPPCDPSACARADECGGSLCAGGKCGGAES